MVVNELQVGLREALNVKKPGVQLSELTFRTLPFNPWDPLVYPYLSLANIPGVVPFLVHILYSGGGGTLTFATAEFLYVNPCAQVAKGDGWASPPQLVQLEPFGWKKQVLSAYDAFFSSYGSTAYDVRCGERENMRCNNYLQSTSRRGAGVLIVIIQSAIPSCNEACAGGETGYNPRDHGLVPREGGVEGVATEKCTYMHMIHILLL